MGGKLGADPLVTAGDETKLNLGLTLPTLQDMAVHADLLRNRSLVESVVGRLGLDRAKPGMPTRGTDAFARATDAILGGLTIQVVPNSNLILVRYRSTDPATGAAIVNALLEQYRDAYLRIRAAPGVARFFAAERDELAGRVHESEKALTAFERETALLAGTEQVNAYARRLAEAESDAIDAQYDAEEAEGRAQILKVLLDREPTEVPTSWTTRSNPAIRMNEERLLALEMDKEHLLTLYTTDDPHVHDKQIEIDAERQRLGEARASERVPGTEVTRINGRRRDLEAQYVASTIAAQKHRIRAEGARAVATEMRDRVRALAIADVSRQALLREVQASADAYGLYRKKAEEGRVTAALDDEEIGNVVIGERASAQGNPVDLPRNVALAFAVVVGLVSGIGGAFLFEYVDGARR